MNQEPAPSPVPDLSDVALHAGGRGPRRIFLESLLIVGVVGLLAGGLVWLRRHGGPGIDPEARQAMVGAELVADFPTAVATQPPAPDAQAPEPVNTPHPDAPPPIEAAGQPSDATGGTASAKAAPKSVVYEIKNGDTLYGIAIEYGVTLDAIVAANGVTDPTGFHVGDKLTIPLEGEVVVPVSAEAAGDAAPAAEAAAAPVDPSAPQPIVVRAQEVYRVQPGDTMDDIAAKHNVPVKDLQAFNPQTGAKAELKAGQEIIIRPAQMATPTALPAGTAIPEQGEVAVAADGGVDLVPALRLLGPGTDMKVTDEVVLLRWSSAGILPEGLYYVVSLRDVTAEQSADGADAQAALPPLDEDPDAQREWVYSNATALRVPPELRPALGAKRVIEWSVTVRRRGTDDSDGIRSDQAGRDVRRFTWVPGAAATGDPTE